VAEPADFARPSRRPGRRLGRPHRLRPPVLQPQSGSRSRQGAVRPALAVVQLCCAARLRAMRRLPAGARSRRSAGRPGRCLSSPRSRPSRSSRPGLVRRRR